MTEMQAHVVNMLQLQSICYCICSFALIIIAINSFNKKK